MNRNIAENDDEDEFSEEIFDEPHADIVMDAIGKRRVIFKITAMERTFFSMMVTYCNTFNISLDTVVFFYQKDGNWYAIKKDDCPSKYGMVLNGCYHVMVGTLLNIPDPWPEIEEVRSNYTAGC